MQSKKNLFTYSNEQREKIAGHVNNYLLFKLYPKVFPSNQSSEDRRTYDFFLNLKELTYEYFQVKKEFARKELFQLVIESKKNIQDNRAWPGR